MKYKNYLLAGFVLVAAISVNFTLKQNQQPEKKLIIEFSLQEANVVIKALQKLPYEEAAGIIASITNQANRQLQSPADTTKPKSKKP